MKFIGQFIQDFIARFRNDVFLENIADGTVANDKFLGLDSNNKIVKEAISSGTTDLTSDVTGTLPISNGGTGQTTAQAALDALAGGTTAGRYLRGDGSNITLSAIQNSDIGTLNQDTTGNAATATALETARNIGGVSFDGTGDINLPGVNIAGDQNTSGTAAVATSATISAANSTAGTHYITFVDGATGTQGLETDTALSYVPQTNLLTAGGFVGSGGSLTDLNSSNITASTSNALGIGSIELGHASDTTIARSAAGIITVEGKQVRTVDRQLHISHHSFTADIDTTKTYVGLVDADSESTSTTGIDMPLVFPTASKLLQVTLRSNKNLSGLTYTFRLETQATGVGFNTGPTIVGTQSGSGPAQTGHATYDFTTSLDSGDNLIDAFDAVYLSIQSSGSTANTKYYITCVWETDLSSY